jgi:mono/diheme cytochrome c family protein
MPNWSWRGAVAVLVLVAVGGALVAYAAGREAVRERRERASMLTGGNADLAEAPMRRFGCAGCHQIPGVTGAVGTVGPALAGLSRRVYIGGVLTNTPENMVRWIINPPAIDEKTAMPATGISEAEARDVAAYLYSLP